MYTIVKGVLQLDPNIGISINYNLGYLLKTTEPFDAWLRTEMVILQLDWDNTINYLKILDRIDKGELKNMYSNFNSIGIGR